MDRASLAAEALFDMRLTKRTAAALPPDAVPSTLADAYRTQELLVGKFLARLGGAAIGYKAAATNVTAQRQMDVDGPFFGTLLSATTHRSPATLPAANFTLRIVEAEFGFEMGADVPASNVPYTAETVAPFVAFALPAIEVVDHRYHDWRLVGAPSLAADNAIHGAWVAGEPVPDWRGLDLSRHPVSVVVNGEPWRVGSGANVLGNPLNVVAWLANELPKHGRRLRRGEKVSTGTTAEVYFASAGDRVTADFGPLGKAEVRFE
ncbi:MAG: fumarylacetoacetate hydrolase family protein [Planctomycetes bacterium]|nr:fumarylacetoacetate hydrolase family protein [Planctomycetota bacterium]